MHGPLVPRMQSQFLPKGGAQPQLLPGQHPTPSTHSLTFLCVVGAEDTWSFLTGGPLGKDTQSFAADHQPWAGMFQDSEQQPVPHTSASIHLSFPDGRHPQRSPKAPFAAPSSGALPCPASGVSNKKSLSSENGHFHFSLNM